MAVVFYITFSRFDSFLYWHNLLIMKSNNNMNIYIYIFSEIIKLVKIYRYYIEQANFNLTIGGNKSIKKVIK